MDLSGSGQRGAHCWDYTPPVGTTTHLHQYMSLEFVARDGSGSAVHPLWGQGQQNSSCSNQLQHLHNHSLALCVPVDCGCCERNLFYTYSVIIVLSRAREYSYRFVEVKLQGCLQCKQFMHPIGSHLSSHMATLSQQLAVKWYLSCVNLLA